MRDASHGSMLVRVDASTSVGTGHAMRCIALAEAWKEVGGPVTFVMASSEASIARRLASDSISLVELATSPGGSMDAELTMDLARKREVDWVVLDGYQFDAEYQNALRRSRSSLLAIDDFARVGKYDVDMLLDQNIGVSSRLYIQVDKKVRLLLGSRYVLLRREFSERRWRKSEHPPRVGRVLLTMGGMDPGNVSLRAIQAIESINEPLDVMVVVGDGNPNYDLLRRETRGNPRVRLERGVSNMAEVMTWPDMAVASAGTTALELAYMGIPAILVAVADNQIPLASGLNSAGVAVSLGWHEKVSSFEVARATEKLIPAREARTEMSEIGRKMIDGKGATRVVRSMIEFC